MYIVHCYEVVTEHPILGYRSNISFGVKTSFNVIECNIHATSNSIT